MTKIRKTIWGRELQLDVSYDCLDDEEILPTQENTLNDLVNGWSTVDDTLCSVKHYCEEHSGGSISADEITNIFKYVMPKSLFVIREPEGAIALMCNFAFDLEHGLAIVFKSGKLDRICTQDDAM